MAGHFLCWVFTWTGCFGALFKGAGHGVGGESIWMEGKPTSPCRVTWWDLTWDDFPAESWGSFYPAVICMQEWALSSLRAPRHTGDPRLRLPVAGPLPLLAHHSLY